MNLFWLWEPDFEPRRIGDVKIGGGVSCKALELKYQLPATKVLITPSNAVGRIDDCVDFKQMEAQE